MRNVWWALFGHFAAPTITFSDDFTTPTVTPWRSPKLLRLWQRGAHGELHVLRPTGEHRGTKADWREAVGTLLCTLLSLGALVPLVVLSGQLPAALAVVVSLACPLIWLFSHCRIVAAVEVYDSRHGRRQGGCT